MVMYKIINGERVKVSSEEEETFNKRRDEMIKQREEKIAAEGYKIRRREQYKSVEEYLDMLWHRIDNGLPLDKTSEFYLDRKAVKDAHPKPGA